MFKFKRNSLVLLAALAFSASSFATGQYGNTDAGSGNVITATPAPGGTVNHGGNHTGVGVTTSAAMSSANTNQANAQGGTSNSTAKGGYASQGQGQQQGIGASGNSRNQVNVGGGDSNYNTEAVAWAPIIHGPAAPALAAGNMVMAPSICGPRVNIVRRDVEGVRFGVWGGQQTVIQGYDEVLAPAENLFIQSGAYLIGHSVTSYTVALGTSSAGSFSVGGFSNNNGAQGGGATSGSMQQIVQRHTVRECVMAQAEPVVLKQAFIYKPAKSKRPPKNDRN